MLKIKEATPNPESGFLGRSPSRAKYVMHEVSAWPATYSATPSPYRLTEVLATLIGRPYGDEVAPELIRRFRDVRGLARAGIHELMSVKGVGALTAARILAAIQIAQAYLTPAAPMATIASPADAVALMLPRLAHLDQEYLFVLLLDTRNQVIGEPIELYHGSVNSSLIRVSEIFRDAIKANATGVIVFHNHPSNGKPDPSPEDVAVTRAIVAAGKQLDVEAMDHIICSAGNWISMKTRGLGFN